MDNLRDRCCFNYCKKDAALIYWDIGLCLDHWTKACSISEGKNIKTRIYVYKHLSRAAKAHMRATYNEMRHAKKTPD